MYQYRDHENREKIDEVFAFLSVDADGNEGICGAIMPGVGAVSMVTGSLKVVEGWKRVAAETAAAIGKKVILVRFKKADVMWRSDTPVATATPIDIA